ncbi:MAG TPA: hypothetical protein VGN63_13535 [Flavisolibacter sp.]|nr:hypothetical protein [Flavisolibacter sp.]
MRTLLGIFFLCFYTVLSAQPKFKIGDRVEASYAGDWLRAVVVGGFQENEFGSTYEVKYDDYQGSTRINSKYVRPLFRVDAAKTFAVGNRVEFRRWDDVVYEGEIIGIDGKKYEIRYEKNGFPTTEWIAEVSVRSSAKAPVFTKQEETKSVTEPVNKPAAGQKFKVGDRVMYDDVGFLATKSYGTVVSYNASTRLYTIRDEKDPSWKYSYACYEVLHPGEKINNEFFIGKWEVYVSGAMTSSEKEGKKYTTITGGMKLPPLEIKANGTYTWTVSKNKVIRGTWKHREGLPGITILKGIDGLDWTVYENTEAHAATSKTRDEIRFHHLPSSSGYYMAYRVGPNKSCVLAERKF